MCLRFTYMHVYTHTITQSELIEIVAISRLYQEKLNTTVTLTVSNYQSQMAVFLIAKIII